MVVGSSSVAIIKTSEIAPVWTKELLHFQATIECGYTLKRVSDMIRTYIQMSHTEKYSEHSSTIWPVGLYSWVFVYQVGGYGFESRCSNLSIKYRASFEERVL